MPRGLSLYNGENDEIVASSVQERIDKVTLVNRVIPRSWDKVSGSMSTNEKSENRIAAMAVEFDHMYLGCTETKASIGQAEVQQHLKDLLLLHLDLIQQQAEQLVAKDKLIKTLRDENENLKSRLDRIDRRVSLSLNKKSLECANSEPKIEVDDSDLFDSLPKQLSSPDRVESQPSKSQSPLNRNASCSKSLSPSTKLTSPSSKPKSPCSKPVSPSSKPASPSSKPGSPSSKPGSPSSKPRSPPSKPGSPSNKVASPGKPLSPVSKSGGLQSKPGSPPSKPSSPSNKSSPVVNKASPPAAKLETQDVKCVSPSNKLQSPNDKVGVQNSRKSLSPQSRVSSPPTKAVSPNSRTSPSLNNRIVLSPSPKPGSPQPKTPQSLDESNDLLTPLKIDLPSTIEGTVLRSGSSPRLRRPSPRSSTQKTGLRERRQRNASQSQSSENDGENEPLKDLPKIVCERERPRLKRKSDSESDTSPLKRIRSDRDRSGQKDDGLTDHNLRSRDKSIDRTRHQSNKDETPGSPTAARPSTPTPRAAALEAKKLRQKLQLKEQSVQGYTHGHKRGKAPLVPAVKAEGILNTGVSYYLPYGNYIRDPNPEEECFQSNVETPRWGTRSLTSLYVMEGTENLEDEIFLKRHAKPEQDEKRRKRWDLQRMREQRHYERLRERYENRQSASEQTSSNHGSLWPFPESAMYLHVEDTLPVCAFGQPLARIPPQEFAIPWLCGQSFEGVSTRRRKR